MTLPIIKRALLSVYDKTGVVEFAQKLYQRDIEIISTGGTASLLQKHGIPITEISTYTGFPELFEGRVKTLHPKVHGGLLCRPGIDDEVLTQYNIQPIGLVVVNLYPFIEIINTGNCPLEYAIENIDIGGPTLLRAAAKNYTAVTVVSDTTDYTLILKEIDKHHGAIPIAQRFHLAQKAFAHTARYDTAIANYLSNLDSNGNKVVLEHSTTEQQTELSIGDAEEHTSFPKIYTIEMIKKCNLRYGENPHQKAAFYKEVEPPYGSIATVEILQGKELSFNNIADADAALSCVQGFNKAFACVIVKHANPCGVALKKTQLEAYQQAYRGDPQAAFGGIIAFNTLLEAETAAAIIDQQYAELIIAPAIEEEAKVILANKPNIRVLSCGQWDQNVQSRLDYKKVTGGLLVQDSDLISSDFASYDTVTTRQASSQEVEDLLFAWHVAKFVKSNAIVYAHDQATIGIGAGQMSRVYSARIATMKAQDKGLLTEHCGSVMASDAFLPFKDNIDTAAAAGITAIIQPGGSIRDQEVINAANEAGLAMIFTHIRHFRH